MALDAGIRPVVGDMDAVTDRVLFVGHQTFASQAPDDIGGQSAEQRPDDETGDGDRPAIVVEVQGDAIDDEPAEDQAAGQSGKAQNDALADLPGRQEQTA